MAVPVTRRVGGRKWPWLAGGLALLACNPNALDALKNGQSQDAAAIDQRLGSPDLDLGNPDDSPPDGPVAMGGSAIDAAGAAGSGAGNGGSAESGGAPGSGGIAGTGGAGGAAGTVGGGAAGGGGRPGTGGGGTDGGLADTRPAPDSSLDCAGVLDSRICWYLGRAGESCTTTCATHGGTSADAAGHVGTAAQGGSEEECGRILNLLGQEGILLSGTRSDGKGLGCFAALGARWWLSSPPYTDNVMYESVQIVCGCVR